MLRFTSPINEGNSSSLYHLTLNFLIKIKPVKRLTTRSLDTLFFQTNARSKQLILIIFAYLSSLQNVLIENAWPCRLWNKTESRQHPHQSPQTTLFICMYVIRNTKLWALQNIPDHSSPFLVKVQLSFLRKRWKPHIALKIYGSNNHKIYLKICDSRPLFIFYNTCRNVYWFAIWKPKSFSVYSRKVSMIIWLHFLYYMHGVLVYWVET